MSLTLLRIYEELLDLASILLQEQKPIWPFYQIGNLIEGFFLLIPLWGIKLIVTLFFLLLALTGFFFPKKYIYQGAEDQKRWKDLRIWAIAVAISEIIVYLYF